MIEILPMADREKESAILDQTQRVAGGARVLAMQERETVLGWVALELEHEILRILKFYADGYDFSRKPQGEEIFILDTLMRSAASYGETFGARKIETVFPDFFGFLQARGFDSDELHTFTPMSTIVKYHHLGENSRK